MLQVKLKSSPESYPSVARIELTLISPISEPSYTFSIKPSLPVCKADNLNDVLSLIGRFAAAFTSNLFQSPIVTCAFPLYSFSGDLVIMFTTPPVEFAPKRVP